MVEVFQKSAAGGQQFLYVTNNHGDPIGILEAEEVLRRVTDPSPAALIKWMDMPAESAIQGRLHTPDVQPFDPTNDDYVQVTHDGVLMGVITNDDVLVSWKSVQQTLQTSQGDAVTGLPNRLKFDQTLDAELNRARRSRHSVSVVLVDLDYFKPINDEYGHAAGDTALKVVASTLRNSLRSYDHVARFGGDEFAVICSGCRPGEIDIVLRRIRHNILNLQTTHRFDHPIPSVSVGAIVAHQSWDIQSPDQLLEAADTALYSAKEAGRNCAFKIELADSPAPEPILVEDEFSFSDQPMANLISGGRY